MQDSILEQATARWKEGNGVRYTIPQTALEAERFLWHALEHIHGSLVLYRMPLACEVACMIIRDAIYQAQNFQVYEESYKRCAGRLSPPGVRTKLRPTAMAIVGETKCWQVCFCC